MSQCSSVIAHTFSYCKLSITQPILPQLPLNTGILLLNLTNQFKDKHLESAYQRYSQRQRQKSLVILNIIDIVLKIIFLHAYFVAESESPVAKDVENARGQNSSTTSPQSSSSSAAPSSASSSAFSAFSASIGTRKHYLIESNRFAMGLY